MTSRKRSSDALATGAVDDSYPTSNLPSTSASISVRPPAAGTTTPGAAAAGAGEERVADHQCAAAHDEERAMQQLELGMRQIRQRWNRAKSLGEQLCSACLHGTLEEVRSLLDSGADVNINSKGWFPLMWAVNRREPNAALVSLLLGRGANPRAVGCHGVTALHWAARNDRSGDTVDLLICAGVDVNSGTQFGLTPLHFAATNGNETAVSLLLAAGASKSQKLWPGL